MSYTNDDLAVVPEAQRTWGTWNYAALWISMSLCVPTYMYASWLIAGGMNWWQAILTVFIGNSVVLVPMVLNGHAGARYGIPFPIFARSSFGIRGANIPALLRAIVGLRMVRHPDLDRRRFALSIGPRLEPGGGGDSAGLSRLVRPGDRPGHRVLRLLAAQHADRLSGHREHPQAALVQVGISSPGRVGLARLGDRGGQGTGADPRPAVQVRIPPANSGTTFSRR